MIKTLLMAIALALVGGVAVAYHPPNEVDHIAQANDGHECTYATSTNTCTALSATLTMSAIDGKVDLTIDKGKTEHLFLITANIDKGKTEHLFLITAKAADPSRVWLTDEPRDVDEPTGARLLGRSRLSSYFNDIAGWRDFQRQS